MTERVKTFSLIAVVAVLAGLLLLVISQVRRSGPSPQEVEQAADNLARDNSEPVAAGQMAASFTLRNLNGKEVSLASLRGKVVFLNIWATWCPPCREEMPSMEKLYEKLHNNKDFQMLAVSQDTGGRQEVAQYVRKHGYNFEVLLDPENVVAESYKITGVPETFIIDRNGRIVAHHAGAVNWARPEVSEALEELLNHGKARG